MESKASSEAYWARRESKPGDNQQPRSLYPNSKYQIPRTRNMTPMLLPSQEYVSSSDSDTGGVKLEAKEGSIHTSPYVKIPRRRQSSYRNKARRGSDVVKTSPQVGLYDTTGSVAESKVTPLTRPASKYQLYDPNVPENGSIHAKAPSVSHRYGWGKFMEPGSRRGGRRSSILNPRTSDNGWIELRDPWKGQASFQQSKGSHATVFPEFAQENPRIKTAAALSAWAAFPTKAAEEDRADALAYKPFVPSGNVLSEIVIKETYNKVVIMGDTFERKIVEKSVKILE